MLKDEQGQEIGWEEYFGGLWMGMGRSLGRGRGRGNMTSRRNKHLILCSSYPEP